MSGDSGTTPLDAANLSPEATVAGDRQVLQDGARPATQVALEEAIRPLAIAGMLTCLAVSVNQFVLVVAPGWPGAVFAALGFLVCLESIHAHRLLERLRLDSKDRIRYRFVEWVVILLVVRFSVYISYGGDRLVSDMAKWSVNVGSIFSADVIVTALLMFALWLMALVLSQTMDELDATPMERMPSVTDPNHYLRSTMPHQGRVDRQSKLNKITTIFLSGGIALLLLAGMSRIDVQDLLVFGHSRSSGVILNVFIYFVIGFLLLSEARFTVLKANWELQSIPVTRHLGQRWIVLVVLFLLSVSVVSAILPVGYSVGIIATLSTVVRWAIYVLIQIVFFVLFLFSYAIGLIMSLFSTTPATPSEPMRRASPPPAPQAVSAGPAPWWQLVRSLIFWTMLAGIIAYSLYHFAGYRLDLLKKLSPAWLWRWLVRAWERMQRGTRSLGAAIRDQLAQRLSARQAESPRRRWRYISLRRLTPRDRVRYFYLSILRRSARQGLGRPPSRTPTEFEETLLNAMPDAGDEVRDLTRAFLVARYSGHDVLGDRASETQSAWRRLKRALRRRRRQSGRDAPRNDPAAATQSD